MEQPSVESRNASDVLKWREENHKVEIKVLDNREKEHNTNPCLTFSEAFGRFPDILHHLGNQTFKKPTPIQSQLWPIALQGRDCIGISQTGSGKTLSFLAPLIAHVKYGGILTTRDNPGKEYHATMPLPDTSNKKPVCEGGPLALILAPVRELAEQIESQINKIFGGLHISDLDRDGSKEDRLLRSLVMVGGKDRYFQISMLQSKQFPHIVVGTPGRIVDLAFKKDLDLSNVSFVVIDEADRMLDMGFQPQIREILENFNVPNNRQMIMTSATWPVAIQDMAKSFLNAPIIVRIGEFDLKCVETVEQNVIQVTHDSEKFNILFDQISSHRVFNDKITPPDQTTETLIPQVAPQLVHPKKSWNNWDNMENLVQDLVIAQPFGNIKPSVPTCIENVYEVGFKMIVFCSMKYTVDTVYTRLRESGARHIRKMHGGHEQVFCEYILTFLIPFNRKPFNSIFLYLKKLHYYIY